MAKQTSIRLNTSDMIPLYSLQGLIQSRSGVQVSLGDTVYISSLALNLLLRTENDDLFRETIATLTTSKNNFDQDKWQQVTDLTRDIIDDIIRGRMRRKGGN